ncbi:hypothetical protein Sa4125_04150 [Aureimonas sp. SA4125]|nr:hypothetical protein Sa4125_04150 [Aureimonas sp. SA4125]
MRGAEGGDAEGPSSGNTAATNSMRASIALLSRHPIDRSSQPTKCHPSIRAEMPPLYQGRTCRDLLPAGEKKQRWRLARLSPYAARATPSRTLSRIAVMFAL